MGSSKRPAEADIEPARRKKVRTMELHMSLTISHASMRRQVQEVTLISQDTSHGKWLETTLNVTTGM